MRLEIPVVLQEDGGTYFVEVSNASGSDRSRNIRLTTTVLPVSFPDEAQPKIEPWQAGYRPLRPGGFRVGHARNRAMVALVSLVHARNPLQSPARQHPGIDIDDPLVCPT